MSQPKIAKTALSSCSDEVRALMESALSYHKQGELANARALYTKILSLQPKHVDCLNLFGLLLDKSGESLHGLELIKQAAILKPTEVEYLYNVGSILRKMSRQEEAIEWLGQAMILNPTHLNSIIELGTCYYDLGKYDQAVKYFSQACKLVPDSAEACNNLALSLKELNKLDESISILREAINKHPKNSIIHSNLLVHLQYDSSITPRILFEEHQHWYQKHGAHFFPFIQPHHQRHPSAPLKIGYVSGDLRRHPVGYSLLAALEHSSKNVLNYCFSNGREDDLTVRLKNACHRWINIQELSDQALAKYIRAEQIDILVDLSGHTAANRLMLFAIKPAPVQVSWLGYYHSTTLKTMDYFISDNIHILPEHERFFTEKIIRLPDCYLCYTPPTYAPEVLPKINEEIIFGSFNLQAKINEDVVKLWAKIVQATPNSKLLLKFKLAEKSLIEAHFHHLFHKHDIAAERIIIESWSPHQEMLAKYNQVDIALDPFPFSGGLTSCEALWMGTPIITMPGVRCVSRQTASYLHAINMPELIAQNEQEYVASAINLAHNPERLADIRHNLRERMGNSPLVNGKLFAANLEGLYSLIRA